MALSKRIVVAVGSQLATVQGLEIVLLTIDFLEQSKSAVTLVARLAILHRVVVANHIDVEQIFDLLERHCRVVDIMNRAVQT